MFDLVALYIYYVYRRYPLQNLEDWLPKNRQNLACNISNVQLQNSTFRPLVNGSEQS